MSSSPPVDRRPADETPSPSARSSWRGRIGRPLTLRARLTIGVVAVITVVCAVVAVTTLILLSRNLTMQLDAQVRQVQTKSQFAGDRNGPTGPVGAVRPGVPCGDASGNRLFFAPGQPIGTLNGAVVNGQVVSSGILTGTGASTECTALSSRDDDELLAVPTDGRAHDVHIFGVGDYRVMASAERDGYILVTGLPTAGNRALLLTIGLIMAAVAGLALVAGAVAVSVIVGRSLRPLGRVAATARQVSTIPLDRGEVDLGVRVPRADTDPRTEVGQVGAALNQMLGHVSQALAFRQASETRVRQFVADASHELRTPLAAIRGYAELARRDEADTEGVAHALRRVESESARMTTLVDDLLLLARLDSGRPLGRDEVDLTALVIDAVSDARVAGPDHRWQLDLPEEPVATVGDAARLHQVLMNLLANARTHTPAGSSVRCALRSDRDGAVITVTDDGPGIPPDLQREVFNRFVRGDSSRSRAAGSTGLGLAIVAAVVAAHGGAVWVDSRPGRTEFTVRLPARPTPAQPEAVRTPAGAGRAEG